MAAHDFTRQHPDPLADALPPLVLDRQRIIHSAAFRRLQRKTQVFVAPQSDHFRTRLTHSLEVAHQARCIAATANLNADLAEVVGLAHDLGHPPFGHAGEKALNECLREHGGFEHNRHTLRIVEDLEHPYPEFYGLNLTHVVRECLAKHDTRYDRPGPHPLQDGQPPPPESVVVDLADRLTYELHDIQDGVYADLLNSDQLQAVELWRWAYTGPAGPPQKGTGTSPAGVLGSSERAELGASPLLQRTPTARDVARGHLRPAIDRIQRRVLEDIAVNRLRGHTSAPHLSPELDAQLAELDQFLLTHLYRSTPLASADEQARHILTDVFDTFIARPDLLPPRFARRVADHGLHRVVTDYVAGMSDTFCLEEHARLCDVPPPAG